MKGHELIERLHGDFCVTGTAGQQVMVQERGTGRIFDVVDVVREVHEDATVAVTHWIIVAEH